MSEYRIEYENDVGGDGGFSAWWAVIGNGREFTCKSQADAEWLAAVLSEIEED